MIDAKLIEVLFPALAAVRVVAVVEDGGVVCVDAQAKAHSGNCPACGNPADRVHDRYVRRIADLAVGGRTVVVRLLVRRFLCMIVACARRTFVEQVPGLTIRYGRISVLLRGVLKTIACALAGRPGARLAARTAIKTSRSTLLRLLRALPVPQVSAGPRVLGVDDFAIRRGSTYATILLDMDTHRPIDVLEGRGADTFADWLRRHPGVEIICRDRGGNYAEGARTGAPNAIQVADRFHLWANLGDAVEKTAIAHRACLPEPAPAEADLPAVAAPAVAAPAVEAMLGVNGEERRLVVQKRERYAAVQDLLADGHSLNAISRQLRLCFRTVQRYARAADLDELLAKGNRASVLDRFKPFLHQRLAEGCTGAARLHEEMQALGWRGSQRTVQRYLQPYRAGATVPEPAPATPKPRRVTRWIMTDPERLTAGEATRLKEILTRCPELDAAHRHVAKFAAMMRNLRGEQLNDWMQAVQADDLPALHSLVTGLRRDQLAVTNGLTLPWSSGPVEGAVNRIKALKRAMFGRANLDLLRRRILLPN